MAGSVFAADDVLTREQNIEARKVFTQATILQKSGKVSDAVTLLKTRFPKGPPTGDLAAAYYRILSSSPPQWIEARDGMKSLLSVDPKNLQYQLTYAAILGINKSTQIEAIQFLARLSKDPNVDKQRVLQSWREVLNSTDAGPDSLQLYQQYLAADPGNQEINARLQSERQDVAERKRIAADPVLSRRQVALDLLEKGDAAAAEPILIETLKALPNDPQTIGVLGLIQMRQGRYEQAIPNFQKALQLNPENAGKWQSLLVASQYWQFIRQASEASERKNYALAEERIKSAMTLDAQGSEAIAVQGNIYVAKGDPKAAEKYYREALQLDPSSDTALRGLIGLYIDSGRQIEAKTLIAWAIKNAGADPKKFDYLQIQLLQADADALIAKGKYQEAITPLKAVLALDPKNPWIRFKLAGAYESLNSVDSGVAVINEGLKLSPKNPEMVNAASIFFVGAGLDQQALQLMRKALADPVSSSVSLELSYADLLNRLQMDDVLEAQLKKLQVQKLSGANRTSLERIQLAFDARLALSMGDTKKAQKILLRAIQIDEDNVWLRYDLARLYSQDGNPPAGDNLFQSYLDRYRNSVDGLYAYALYLSNADRYSASLQIIERVPLDRRTQKLSEFQRSTWVRAQVSQVQQLNSASHAAAVSKLNSLELELKDDPDLSALVALGWSSIGEEARANLAFQKIAQENGDLSVEWRLQYARYLLGSNQSLAYQDQISKLNKLKLNRTQDKQLADLYETEKVKLIEGLIQSGDLKEASQLLEPLSSANPKNYQLMSLSSQIQRREGRVDQAIATEQFALAHQAVPIASEGSLSRLKPASDSSKSGVSIFSIESPALNPSAVQSGSPYQYQQLGEMLDSRANWLSTAFDYLSLSGTPGQSYYHASEIPVEWRMPIRSDEKLIFRADQVNINAGSIDLTNSYQTSTFGTMALCQPNCSSALTQQSAAGTGLNVGYEKQGFKADIGTTPIGFLVQNWIGGIRQKADIGPVGVAVDISRRPMTSTLLSYAGTRDPRTGSTWGGVVATGGTISASLDKGETLGGWTTFRARSLTGMNVQTNSDTQFMAGLNWRIVNESDRLLTSGLTGMLWGFKKNAGEFTYGQGGYYSPQSYRSLTLPLSYSQRMARFSYIVSGTVSTNWSRTDAAPYYPMNADYQSAAGNPFYSASSGPGSAYSMLAAWEYQVSPSLFIGNRIKLERSPYYAPNSAVVYLRFALDQVAAQPVLLQAQPVIPTSRF